MEIHQLSLMAGARAARGVTVVIDVFRAFSVAAYCFARGARELLLVGEVQEAFALRRRFADALLIGEVGGRRIEGFDFGNSPTHIAETERELSGRRFIQRTSAGTQGVVLATAAEQIVLGSFLCAEAIVQYIRQRDPAVVSLVGMGDGGAFRTEEDDALSDYLAARLHGTRVDIGDYVLRARESPHARRFREDHPDAPRTDVDYALQPDKFGFVLTVAREDGLLVARRVELVTAGA